MAAPMKSTKEKIQEIIETLNENQAEYVYHLMNALFCQTAD